MNKLISNLANKVIKKMSAAVLSDNFVSNWYFRKWNIEPKSIVNSLTSTNLHGGIYSKGQSLSNIKITNISTVLDIGPETGFEVFLLAELFPKVLVCDPDEDNLNLLKEVAKKYRTEAGAPALNKIEFLPYGINNKNTFNEEKRIFNSLRELGLSGKPTFYKITSKREVTNLHKKVDLVFIHKIFSTITRSSTISPKKVLDDAVQILQQLTNKAGQISWTEPEAIWQQMTIDLESYTSLIYKYKLRGIQENYTQMVVKC